MSVQFYLNKLRTNAAAKSVKTADTAGYIYFRFTGIMLQILHSVLKTAKCRVCLAIVNNDDWVTMNMKLNSFFNIWTAKFSHRYCHNSGGSLRNIDTHIHTHTDDKRLHSADRNTFRLKTDCHQFVIK